MPQPLDLGDLDTLLAGHATRRLGDPELPGPTLLAQSVEKEVPIAHDDLACTVGGEARINIFNAPEDEDPAGLLGEAPAEGAAPKDVELRTPLHFEAGSAWLVYRTSARVKAKARPEVPKFGFAAGLDGDASVRFHDYRRHGAEDRVGPSVALDLATARFAISPADVRALGPGEALALEVNGTLRATARLRWSDVFTTHIGTLGALLAPGEDFGLKIGARLWTSFRVGIEDRFLVVFSRRRAGEIDVQVRRSDEEALALRAAARISVRAADRRQAEAAIRAAVEAVLGEPLAEVRAILAKRRVADLGRRERALAERLVDRLRMDGERLRLAALRERIEELESEAEARVTRIAEQEARFAVDFLYSRSRTEEALIEATLDEARVGDGFGALHGAIVRGDFERMLADGASAAASGVSVRRFLQKTEVKRTKSWGVSLRLGDLFSVGGKARTYMRETMRRDRRLDRSRFSFTAIEDYAGSWGRDRCTWKTTLTATSRDWTPGAEPTADALRFTLHHLMHYGERRLSARDAARFADLGVLWGSVTPGGARAVRERLERLGRARSDVEVSFHLRFRKGTFPTLLRLLAEADARAIGLALGRAVPSLAGEAGRETPLLRELLYGDLWRQYLEDPSLSPRDLAAAASASARAEGHAGLAGFEGRMRHWWTVGDLARRNGETRARWRDLARGAARLHEAIEEGGPYTEVAASARLMRRGWEHAFHVRAFGAHLMEAFRTRPEFSESVSRSLRVEYRERGERVVLNLGRT